VSFLADLGRVLVQDETKIIDLRLKGCTVWDKNEQSMFQEVLLRLCRQNRASFSGVSS
jgi:hypothetical protein